MVNRLVNTPFRVGKTGKGDHLVDHHQDASGGLFSLDDPLHLGQLAGGQILPPADSPDGQVAMETAAFRRKPVLGQSFIDLSLQCPEQLITLADSNPERTRTILAGKSSQAGTFNLQRILIGHCQAHGTADTGEFGFRDIPKKLQRQVQVLSTSPVDSGQAGRQFILQ